VLDFGLAKAFATAGKPVDPADIPTGSQHDTLKGTILGTPAYMSPEQASGKEVDKRADIWSFGCILYELLSGKQAFQGETITEIIASVLKSEPDWSALPETTPSNIRALLRRCLQKETKRRSRDATEIHLQIEETLTGSVPETPTVAKAAPPAPLGRRALPWAVAVVLSVIVGIGVWSLKPGPGQRPVSRLVMALPSGDLLMTDQITPSVALSPDGVRLAYVAVRGNGQPLLYLRDMDSLEAKPIPGTEGASAPFFSPDGQWIGFFAGGKLKKVSVSGGASLALCDAPSGRGASWGPADTIFFTPTNGPTGILKVPAAGGTPQVLTTADAQKQEASHRWPEVLPGGKALFFVVFTGGGPDTAQIVAQSLQTGERRVLVQGGTSPHYSPSGHLLYHRAGTLMAVPFDPVRLEVQGIPAPVLEGVMGTEGLAVAAHFTVSRNGTLVYVPGSGQAAERTLVWVDRKGAAQPLAAPLRAYAQPRLSPDGRRLAIEIEAGTRDLWVYDFAREALTRLTFEGNNGYPTWTPDGKKIAFQSFRAGRTALGLFWKLADGTGAEASLPTGEYNAGPGSWTPDGKVLAFWELNPSTLRDIWALPMEGDPRQAGTEGRKPRLFLRAPFNETAPTFSPDGRWLAYVSDESGRNEVYVQPFPGPGGPPPVGSSSQGAQSPGSGPQGGKWQVSTEGGTGPVWNRNGRELFYRIGDRMMAVDVTAQPAFAAGKPRLLFEARYDPDPGASYRANYDVAPDGQRFLMVKGPETTSQLTQVNMVLDWFEELKRRVPVP